MPEFAVDMNLRGGMLSGGYPVHDGDVALRIGGEIRFARVRWEEPLFYDYGYYGNEESHDQYYSFTAAADLQFARYFHAGMGGTYKSLDLDWAFLGLSGSSAKGDGSAYDIGFLLAYSRTDAARWSFTPALGVSLRNFGSGISLDNSGGTIEPLRHNAYGASIQIQSPHTTVLDSSVPTFAMVFNVDLEKAEALNTAYTAGLELGFWQIVFARLGFQAVQDRKPKELTLGVGAGLPLRSFMFRLDYALVPLDIINSSYNHLDRANKFSLVLGWTPRHSVESN